MGNLCSNQGIESRKYIKTQANLEDLYSTYNLDDSLLG